VRVKAEVLSWIAGDGGAVTSVDELTEAALRLYAWQCSAIGPYGAFAAGRQPVALEEIPAVPVALYRDLPLRHRMAQVVFRTSGTTSGRRGEHWMVDTDVYDTAARRWFEACVPDAPVHTTVSLVPPPQEVPDSSLGHMIATLAPGAAWRFVPGRGVDGCAWQDLGGATGPVFLPATAFALDQLLDRGAGVELAPGSVVMITGGFKGRRRAVSRSGLEAKVRQRLGHGLRIVHEYGMTELSSQLWDTGDGYVAPPWLHVYTAHPATGRPAPEGLLCFVDLANWSSPLAIETEDLGRVVDGRVELLGRLPRARARGCSLTAEEARWSV